MIEANSNALIQELNREWLPFLEKEIHESELRLYYAVYIEDDTYRLLKESEIRNFDVKKILNKYICYVKFVSNKKILWDLNIMMEEGEFKNISSSIFQYSISQKKVLFQFMERFFQKKNHGILEGSLFEVEKL
ncbi:hypothetical protein [Bacillus cereus group sp. TH152-1LC]|uniref:hypothetical protein n=1 Tax=Bacillus cereus group sp. TH152-1LC TaxID=3018060 RepID=UPI0022DF8FF5|nr:hypothetical protein [Bacillus cereus group sp. TH152-1LC]MDA1675440.1 hypothetical protein [Bacillus cereus group sp. TH152-1LC]